MKKITFYILLLSVVSCQYFDKQVPSEQELLNKQMKEINWKEVDEYPSVADCEAISDETLRKQCFFEFLTSAIQQKLCVDSLSVLFPKLDTLAVRVSVNPDATMQFEPKFPIDTVAYDTIKIDSIIRLKLVDFPKVNPAIKRGIPVKTQFVLPIIIKTKK